MRVGLYFGSFNPIHIGHLSIAQWLIDHVPIDVIWFIVSPLNPFKDPSTLLPVSSRLALVRLALQDYPKFVASEVELHLAQPSYTIDTLNYLACHYPKDHFSIIMGEDNYSHIHQWKASEYILAHYPIYVYKRSKKVLLPYHDNVYMLNTPILPISSSQIRLRIKAKQSIQHLVPREVDTMIQAKGYYQ